MNRSRLDDGIADIRKPVESLTDIQASYRSTHSIGGCDMGIRFQVALHHVSLYVIAEYGDAFLIDRIGDLEESLGSAKHHQPNIDAFAPLDIRHKAQHAVEVGDGITHGVGPDWRDPGR